MVNQHSWLENAPGLKMQFPIEKWGDIPLPAAVDGRNPAPVEVGSLSHYLRGLYIPGWFSRRISGCHQQ